MLTYITFIAHETTIFMFYAACQKSCMRFYELNG